MPVSALRAVSVTPGSTPPCASVTTPTIAPPVVCAPAETARPRPSISAVVVTIRNAERDRSSLRNITPPCYSDSQQALLQSSPPLPRPLGRRADQHLGLSALAGHELLRTAHRDLGEVQIAFLVDADFVHAEHPPRVRKVDQAAPPVQEVAFEVVLQELPGPAIRRPELAIDAHVQGVHLRDRPIRP